MGSIESLILDYASKYPNKIALIEKDIFITYNELANRITNTSKLLKQHYNVADGSFVALSAQKRSGFLYTYFAIHLCKAVAIILDPEVSQDKFSFIEKKIGPLTYIGSFKFKDPNSNNDFYSLVESNNLIDYDLNYNNSEDTLSNVADILFTTGTTGEPKGVQLTNKNILAAVNNINSYIGNSENDIELVALPVSHSFGLGRIRCVLARGGTVLLFNGFTNVKKLFSCIEDYNVTGIAFVPSAWDYVYKLSGDKIGKYKDQLKYIEIGSAPMAVHTKMRLAELLPKTKICMHYGLTEASRSLFLELHDKSKLHTLGIASPNVSVKIIDHEGRFLGCNLPGEIVINGDHVCKSFLSEVDNNNSFLSNGYLRTGDIGIMDSDGYVQLVGRSKEMINVGGKKVSPIEIENLVNDIEGVTETACIGIDDPDGLLGEVIKIFIVGDHSRVTNSEILDFLKTKVEQYKLPKYFEWVRELPKTDSGKIQRLKLK